MKIDLGGKRVVVTGGSRGIGRAIALACAEAGAAVSICARGADGLAAVRDEIAAHGVTAHAAACDVADPQAVAGYIAAAAEALGGIDILVCNASGFGSSNDEAGWARSIDVDLMGTVRAVNAAEPFLEQSGAGAVITISSTAAFHSSVRTTPYSVVKSALVQYTRNRAAGAQRRPRQLRRAGIDRVSRRQLGEAQDRQPEPLQRDPQEHSIRPARPPRGGRARRRFSGLAAGQLGDRPDNRGRWRAAVVTTVGGIRFALPPYASLV